MGKGAHTAGTKCISLEGVKTVWRLEVRGQGSGLVLMRASVWLIDSHSLIERHSHDRFLMSSLPPSPKLRLEPRTLCMQYHQVPCQCCSYNLIRLSPLTVRPHLTLITTEFKHIVGVRTSVYVCGWESKTAHSIAKGMDRVIFNFHAGD